MNNCKKLWAISCGLLAILNSCKDNTGTLGANILPKSDLISAHQTDTDTIVTSMYLKDSVVTNAVLVSLLGSFNDPIFGETKASIYAEVYPSGSLYTYPPWTSNSKVDSVVLLLQLFNAPYYGSSDPQTYLVYQTDTDIISPHAYYSDTNIKYNPTPIGEEQVTPPNAAGTQNDTLRIKLSKSWWSNFATNLEFNNQWTTNFNHLLHGLYITTSTPLQLPGQGSILNANLNASFSGIYLYYHNLLTDSAYYVTFPIGGSSDAYFVHYDHNYSTTYLGSMRPSGKRDSLNGSQLMYVQGIGGVIGRLNFPNLYKNWSKLGPVIVNEAVVTFPVQPQISTASYAPPQQINLLATDTNWVQTYIPDLGQSYFNGSFDAANNTYTCVITQYIQSVINGKTIDRGLYVCANNQPDYANGVVIYGAQHGVSKAQRTTLTIYYTPLKNP